MSSDKHEQPRNDRLLTLTQARPRLGNVGPRTMREWEKLGILTLRHINGRGYITESELDRLVAAGVRSGAPRGV